MGSCMPPTMTVCCFFFLSRLTDPGCHCRHFHIAFSFSFAMFTVFWGLWRKDADFPVPSPNLEISQIRSLPPCAKRGIFLAFSCGSGGLFCTRIFISPTVHCLPVQHTSWYRHSGGIIATISHPKPGTFQHIRRASKREKWTSGVTFDGSDAVRLPKKPIRSSLTSFPLFLKSFERRMSSWRVLLGTLMEPGSQKKRFA